MIKDGRQVSTTLDGIRDDHVRRYQFAAQKIKAARASATVLDVGCGCGYGSFILANSGFQVKSTDIDQGALDYGSEHYGHPNVRRYQKNWEEDLLPVVDAIVAFEVIEHLQNPIRFCYEASRHATLMLGSVPNQDVVPFDVDKHHRHFRHYSPDQLTELFEQTRWQVLFLGGQVGKRGSLAEVVGNPKGCRTLVFVCRSV